MKTIKELAEEYIELQRKEDEYLNVPDVEVMSVEDCEIYWRYTFAEIAKIQRDADIEKAVEWLKNTFEGGGYVQDWQIEEFVKVMKGE